MKISILTLFPDFFSSPLRHSVLGRAVKKGLLEVDFIDPRNFASPPHFLVDDTPYGGGAGMVLRVDIMEQAIAEARSTNQGPVVMMTPRGKPLSQKILGGLAKGDFTILCGHYEGYDERIHRYIDEEISVGDYVLTGGEPAALTVMDGTIRLVPGVLGNPDSSVDESFMSPRLEYPCYTKPRKHKGQKVPEVLLSGNHARIDRFRRMQSLLLTLKQRPDLLVSGLTEEEEKFLLEAIREFNR
jgi:tRNA (guanine37-N1)-methyltransferase